MYPAGQCWSDKVCVDDPSFYLACELNNGVFTGEKHQCPPGMQFYHGANQMWEKTCVPADKCKTKQCPNWLGQPTPGWLILASVLGRTLGIYELKNNLGLGVGDGRTYVSTYFRIFLCNSALTLN